MFEANQAAQAFEIAAIQNQFGGEFEIDVFTNEEFIQTKESFILIQMSIPETGMRLVIKV